MAEDVASEDQLVGFVVFGGVDAESADLFLEEDGVEASTLLAEGVGFPEVLVERVKGESEVGSVEEGLLDGEMAFVRDRIDGFTELDRSREPPDAKRKESDPKGDPRDDGDALPIPFISFLSESACAFLKISKGRERNRGARASNRRRVIKHDIRVLEAL